MGYFVYIIQSLDQGIFYKGSSSNPLLRLVQHNENRSRYTSGKGPWKLVFIQGFETKTEALIKERKIKKYSRKQIKTLIQSPYNEIK